MGFDRLDRLARAGEDGIRREEASPIPRQMQGGCRACFRSTRNRDG
jgi:hypothetical protein